MPPPTVNKAAQSGFEIQRRRHKKSKTGVSVVQQKDLCPPQILKKLTNMATADDIFILVKSMSAL